LTIISMSGLETSGCNVTRPDWKRFFAPCVPLRVAGGTARSFAESLDATREQIQLVGQHQTYARDMGARYPALKAVPDATTSQVLPVMVERAQGLDDHQPLPGSVLTLIIGDEAQCRWFTMPGAG
jgi:hypothetical protein